MGNGANRSRNAMGDDVNYLRPDILETTNRILLDIDSIISQGETLEEQENPIAISAFYFNKKTRTFHSLNVWGSNGWQSEQIDTATLSALSEKLSDLKKELGNQISYSDGDKWCERLDDLLKRLEKTEISQQKLLQTYAHMPLRLDEYLSGIMYQCLSNRTLITNTLRDFLSFIVVDVDFKSETLVTKCIPWEWAQAGTTGLAQSGLTPFEIPQVEPKKSPVNGLRHEVWWWFAERFYLDELEKWAIRHGAENAAGLATLIIPVFDCWDVGRGYGGLWGVLVCSFANAKTRALYLGGGRQYRLFDLLLEVERVADAYFEAGIAKVATTALRPPYDWISLFVQRLHWIQDWDRVTVCNGEKPLYCYRHFKPKGDCIEWSWKPCEKAAGNAVGNEICTSCRKAEGRLVFKWSDVDAQNGRHPILSPMVIK